MVSRKLVPLFDCINEGWEGLDKNYASLVVMCAGIKKAVNGLNNSEDWISKKKILHILESTHFGVKSH